LARSAASRTAAPSSSNATRTRAANRSPSSVSRMPRPDRSTSRTPSSASSAFSWWLIAPCVTLSSLAARVRLRKRAVASRARNACIAGSRGMAMPIC
jgi:hypothetical protein